MRTRHGAITIDDSRLPIVDVAYHGQMTLDEYREAFAEYARLAIKGRPMVYLIDMRAFDPLRITAETRRSAAGVFHDYQPRLAPVSIAEARVISSPMTRGIVTAFDWLTSANKWPCRQFAALPEAEAWLREQLRAGASRGA